MAAILHKAATCCSKHKLERSYIKREALLGSASNFSKSPDTSTAQFSAVPDPDLEIRGERSSRPLDKWGGGRELEISRQLF